MKKKNILIFLLIIWSFYASAQDNLVIPSIPLEKTESNQIHNFVININKFLEGENYIIEIRNFSLDTIYLFDSYLSSDLITSKYLHRYNTNQKKCKLSLLPLIPYLSVNLSDVIILGKEKIIKKNKTLYSFTPIYPKSMIKVKIPVNALEMNYKILDFDVKTKGSFEDIYFKNVKYTESKCSDIIIELAIYKNINLLNSKEAYYLNSEDFAIQSIAFEILEVPISSTREELYF